MSNPPLDATAKKLTRPELGLVILLAAINCVQITDALLVNPLAKKLQSDMPMTAEEYSFAVSIYGFAAAVCGILSSAVVDRFDRKRVILVAFAGLIVSFLASGLAVNFASLFVARLFAGAFGGLTTCATLAVIGDLIPESRRGSALGLLGAAFAVAAVIGLPICAGASLLSKYIAPAFVAETIGGIAVWIWALVKLPICKGHLRAIRPNPLREFGLIVAERNHAIAFLFMLCVSLGTFCIINFMAQYLELNCGVPEQIFTIIFLAMGLCSLGAAMLSGKLTDRFGRKPIFFVAVALTIAMVGIVVTLPPVPMVVAGLVASGFMAIAVARLIPTHSIMLLAANPARKGAYTTVYNSVSHLGTSIGPLIAGQIVFVDPVTNTLANYPIAGAVACGFSLLGIGLSFFVKPARAEANA